MGLKVSVYGETSETLSPASLQMPVFPLKVSVYGVKGECLY